MNTQIVTGKQLKLLLEKQEYRCAYTGELMTPETASLDHVIPLGRDGVDSIENIAIVLQQVNYAKGTMTREEFVEMCGKVWLYHQSQLASHRAA